MTDNTADLRSELSRDLRHRIRPMRGRDPNERGRSSTPLELLYDLTYVIAFAAAAEQLAHHVGEGHVLPAVGAYVFAIFSVSWAWMNFTWFTSAYGNDDAALPDRDDRADDRRRRADLRAAGQLRGGGRRGTAPTTRSWSSDTSSCGCR